MGTELARLNPEYIIYFLPIYHHIRIITLPSKSFILHVHVHATYMCLYICTCTCTVSCIGKTFYTLKGLLRTLGPKALVKPTTPNFPI